MNSFVSSSKAFRLIKYWLIDQLNPFVRILRQLPILLLLNYGLIAYADQPVTITYIDRFFETGSIAKDTCNVDYSNDKGSPALCGWDYGNPPVTDYYYRSLYRPDLDDEDIWHGHCPETYFQIPNVICTEYKYYFSSECPVGSAPNENGECFCSSGQSPSIENGCKISDKNQGPPNSCPGTEQHGGTNPINLGVGNKYQIETDFSGAGAFPLSVTRAFNSISAIWQFLPEINPAVDLSEVAVVRSDGKTFTFPPNGTGDWAADPDVTDTLQSFDDGAGAITSWRYIALDQQVEDYDASGKLLSITDRSGLSHIYVHTSTDIAVTHSNGDVLVYQLDGSGRISGFTTPDNETYTYSYDGAGNLSGLTYPNSGGTRVYHYEDTNFPNALTGITDANGDRFATWTYDSQGRAISSTHHNGVNAVDLHSIDYTYLDDATDPRSTVTNPLGKQTTYHFTTLYGVRKVTQVEGHPSTNCAAANKNYGYDANGFVASKTDWQGNTSTYIRNAKGQELTRTEAAGTPEQRVITTKWHSTFNLPTKLTEPGKETSITYDAVGNEFTRRVVELP